MTSQPAIAGPTPASTRDRIPRAAAGLFAERGYGGVSVREIADAVGVAPSALYAHYHSKADILVAFLDHAHNEVASMLRAAMLELGGESAIAQLAELTRRMATHWLAEPGATRVMLVELERQPAARDGAARALRDDAVQTFVDVITRGQAHGEIAAAEDPLLLAWTIRGIVNQLAVCATRSYAAPPVHAADALATFSSRLVTAPRSRRPLLDVRLPTVSPVVNPTTRDRILAAASRLFAGRGFEVVPVRDIAAAVGIKAPSIYAHFDSKAHLRAAIIERTATTRSRLLNEAIERQPEDAWRAKVTAWVWTLAAAAIADPDGVIVNDDQIDRLPEDEFVRIDQIYRQMSVVFEEVVAGGRRAGVFHFTESREAVVRCLAAMAIQLAWRARFVRDFDPTGIADAHAVFALRIVDSD